MMGMNGTGHLPPVLRWFKEIQTKKPQFKKKKKQPGVLFNKSMNYKVNSHLK